MEMSGSYRSVSRCSDDLASKSAVNLRTLSRDTTSGRSGQSAGREAFQKLLSFF